MKDALIAPSATSNKADLNEISQPCRRYEAFIWQHLTSKKSYNVLKNRSLQMVKWHFDNSFFAKYVSLSFATFIFPPYNPDHPPLMAVYLYKGVYCSNRLTFCPPYCTMKKNGATWTCRLGNATKTHCKGAHRRRIFTQKVANTTRVSILPRQRRTPWEKSPKK